MLTQVAESHVRRIEGWLIDESRDEIVLVDPRRILYGFLATAVAARRVVAPWAAHVRLVEGRVHLRVDPDQLVVTSYRTVAKLLEELGEPTLVRVHHGVFANVLRVDRRHREGKLLFYPRGRRERSFREVLELSADGRRDFLSALGRMRRRG